METFEALKSFFVGKKAFLFLHLMTSQSSDGFKTRESHTRLAFWEITSSS